MGVGFDEEWVLRTSYETDRGMCYRLCELFDGVVQLPFLFLGVPT